MKADKAKLFRRRRRKRGIRKSVIGTSQRPRLTVFRSLNHVYAQIIDDERGVTLVQASSRNTDLRDAIKSGGNIEGAKVVGVALAERAKAANIERVCFDRNGFKYHGRIKGLADAAREGGLSF